MLLYYTILAIVNPLLDEGLFMRFPHHPVSCYAHPCDSDEFVHIVDPSHLWSCKFPFVVQWYPFRYRFCPSIIRSWLLSAFVQHILPAIKLPMMTTTYHVNIVLSHLSGKITTNVILNYMEVWWYF